MDVKFYQLHGSERFKMFVACDGRFYTYQPVDWELKDLEPSAVLNSEHSEFEPLPMVRERVTAVLAAQALETKHKDSRFIIAFFGTGHLKDLTALGSIEAAQAYIEHEIGDGFIHDDENGIVELGYLECTERGLLPLLVESGSVKPV
jgi:hypothetical protein